MLRKEQIAELEADKRRLDALLKRGLFVQCPSDVSERTGAATDQLLTRTDIDEVLGKEGEDE